MLWRYFRPQDAVPATAPALGQVVRWIARLGGFLDRRGDGAPGVKVLWSGLRKLHAMKNDV